MAESIPQPTKLPAPVGASVELVLWKTPYMTTEWSPPEDGVWPSLPTVQTIGWVIHENNELLMLGMTEQQDVEQGCFSGVQLIPCTSIIQRRHLWPPLS